MDSSGWKIFLLGLGDLRKALVFYAGIVAYFGLYYLGLSYLGNKSDSVFIIVGLLLAGVLILFTTVYRINKRIDEVHKAQENLDIDVMREDIKKLQDSVNCNINTVIKKEPECVFHQNISLWKSTKNPSSNRFNLPTDGQQWFRVEFHGEGSIAFEANSGLPVCIYVIDKTEYDSGDLSSYYPAQTAEFKQTMDVKEYAERFIGIVSYENYAYEANWCKFDIISLDVKCKVHSVPFIGESGVIVKKK